MLKHLYNKLSFKAEEIVQGLKALFILLADLALVPSMHIVSTNQWPDPGNQIPYICILKTEYKHVSKTLSTMTKLAVYRNAQMAQNVFK